MVSNDLMDYYRMIFNGWLVVWNMNFYDFPQIGNVIIPTDELIFSYTHIIPYFYIRFYK